MRSIIFAAGQSKRLGELTKNLPKACLNLFNKTTILDFSLGHLAECGFTELVLVTGHASPIIEKYIRNKWKHNFEKIDFVFNPEFTSRNNIYSAYLVRDLIDDDTFILNSDIVYDKRILENAIKIFKSCDNTKSFLIADDHKKLIDEDMKIQLSAQTLSRISKELENDKSIGEYIGILHLEGNDISKFRKSLEYLIDEALFDFYYEDALDRILNQIQLSYISTKGYAWAEVDTPEDYINAQELVNSKILNTELIK